MQFTPATPEEIEAEQAKFAQFQTLPDGIHSYEALEASPQRSASGNDMIKLKLEVTAANGARNIIFDYLLEKMKHKLYHFAWGTGLGPSYAAGTLEADDCVGRKGKVKIKTEPAKTENGKTYAAKNVVDDYIPDKAAIAAFAAEQKAKPKPEPELANPDDDDVPFS